MGKEGRAGPDPKVRIMALSCVGPWGKLLDLLCFIFSSAKQPLLEWAQWRGNQKLQPQIVRRRVGSVEPEIAGERWGCRSRGMKYEVWLTNEVDCQVISIDSPVGHLLVGWPGLQDLTR